MVSCHIDSGRVWKMNSLSPEVALSRISPELRPLLCSVVRNGRVGLDSSSCLRITDLKSGWVFGKLNKSITLGEQCICTFSKLWIWLISWTEIAYFRIKILSQMLNQKADGDFSELINEVIIGHCFFKYLNYNNTALGMFISVIFPNQQPTLINRLLTVNWQDYLKLELN